MTRLPPIVESPRLMLRQWTEGDAAAMPDAIEVSLEHLRPWMEWIVHEPSTMEDRIAHIRSNRTAWEQGGDSVFGVFHNGVVVGACGLHHRGEPDSVEIGYWMSSSGRKPGRRKKTANPAARENPQHM